MIPFNKIGFTFVKQSPAWHTLAQIVLQHHGQQSKAFLASFLNLRECYHLNHTDGRQPWSKDFLNFIQMLPCANKILHLKILRQKVQNNSEAFLNRFVSDYNCTKITCSVTEFVLFNKRFRFSYLNVDNIYSSIKQHLLFTLTIKTSRYAKCNTN